MTTETLDKLRQQTLDLIGKRAGAGDVTSIQQLSETATRIDHFREQVSDIERNVEAIRQFLAGFAAPNGSKSPSQIRTVPLLPTLISSGTNLKRGAKKLRIDIDWEKVGLPAGTHETIADNVSSSSITRFLKRLSEVLGEPVLVKLASFRISRGPLVSMEPAADFYNHAQGVPYAHHEIPGTKFFVLTNTSTSEKASDLRHACKFLGLPFSFATISEVDK